MFREKENEKKNVQGICLCKSEDVFVDYLEGNVAQHPSRGMGVGGGVYTVLDVRLVFLLLVACFLW